MPNKSPDPRRRCVKIDAWPDLDRALWAEGLARPSSIDHTNVCEQFRAASIRKARDGYGRWLGFLRFNGELDEAEHPAARVTVPRIQAYFGQMRELGNADYTLVGRLHELTIGLSILAPDRDFRWLLQPGGTLVRTRLPMASRTLFVPDARELLEWGLEIASRGLQMHANRRRQVAVRDGLMIAILACRAPRLSSLRHMKLERNLVRRGKSWRLRFLEQEVKNHRPIEYDLPGSLTDLIERYLAVERRQLLAGKEASWVWINWQGELLKEAGVQKRILWLSRKRFGVAFCPHRFRHALATTAPNADPQSDGVGASLLGISTRVLRRHYDRGGQVRAATEMQRNVAKVRTETEGHAGRAFKE